MRTTYAAVLVVSGVLLGACTGEEEPSSAGSTPPAATSTASDVSTPTPLPSSGLETPTGRRAPRVFAITTRSDELVLTVITWGSSTCAFDPVDVAVVDGRLELAEEVPSNGRPCTLDYRRSVVHPDAKELDLEGVHEAVIRFDDRPAQVVPIIIGIE